MEKYAMREWVIALEGVVDNKLRKWRKHDKIENGEAIQVRWQFEQTHMHLDIFWDNNKETVSLQYLSPRICHSYLWHGLDNKTMNRVMDRVGNLAQITMYPPVEPNY